MSIIYVLIPLAIILVGVAVMIFFWAVRSNQFEDLDRQGYSILFDDDVKDTKQASTQSNQNDSSHQLTNEKNDKAQ